MKPVTITFDDLRTVGICDKCGPWLAGHGLNIKDLHPKRGGIPVSKLYALKDQGDQIKLLEQAAIKRIDRENSK